MKPVRISAKAIIIENEKILLLKHEDEAGDWFALPGGGQENGETLTDALKRECIEEINTTVKVNEVLFIRDYIAKNHEFSDAEGNTHQVEIMFECSLIEKTIPLMGEKPDSTQKDVVWMELKDLHKYRFFPKEMISFLQSNFREKSKIYLGDIN